MRWMIPGMLSSDRVSLVSVSIRTPNRINVKQQLFPFGISTERSHSILTRSSSHSGKAATSNSWDQTEECHRTYSASHNKQSIGWAVESIAFYIVISPCSNRPPTSSPSTERESDLCAGILSGCHGNHPFAAKASNLNPAESDPQGPRGGVTRVHLYS